MLGQVHDLVNLLPPRSPACGHDPAVTGPNLANPSEANLSRQDRTDRGNPHLRGDLGVGHTIGGHQQHLWPAEPHDARKCWTGRATVNASR